MRLIIFLFLSSVLHDIPVSDTHIYLSQDYVDVEISLEANDVRLAMNDAKLTESKVVNYIKQQLALFINGNKISISYCQYQLDNGHIYLSGESLYKSTTASTVQVNNTLLIDHVANQSNNVYCHAGQDFFKGYLMNAERRKIMIPVGE